MQLLHITLGTIYILTGSEILLNLPRLCLYLCLVTRFLPCAWYLRCQYAIPLITNLSYLLVSTQILATKKGLCSTKQVQKPPVVAQASSFSTWQAKAGRSLEFKDSLIYIVNSGQPGLHSVIKPKLRKRKQTWSYIHKKINFT